MTRTDVMASSRPHTADAAPIRKGSIFGSRRLVALPVALLLVALTVPTTALAAGSTSQGNRHSQTAPAPKSGTSPSKEKSTPTKAVAPATTSSAPTSESAKAQTLPFTGFDLRLTIGIGVLLMAAGISIVTVQRRHRRNPGG